MLTEKRGLKLDEKAVMQTMGQLLSLRGLINLHLPLNETPEAYWEVCVYLTFVYLRYT
jgi:uncharacterized Rmd1/YagE family protein